MEGFRAGERGGLNGEEGREGAIIFMWARDKEAMSEVPRGCRGCSAGFPQHGYGPRREGTEMEQGSRLLELGLSARQDHEPRLNGV